MFTRRSASRAAMAANTGTPTATARTSNRLSVSSAGKNGWSMNGIAATGMRSRKKTPKPAATPAIPAVVDSIAAITETCLRVAPAQPHRGEPFLTAGGRQPGGGGDEDQHRQQDGQRHDGQDEVDGVRAASRVDGEVGRPLGFGVVGQPRPRHSLWA